MQDTGEWEFAYILPSLTPHQQEKLTPILRAAATSIRHAVEQGYHPLYNSGEKVWTTAGLHSVRVSNIRYGGYEPISEVGSLYRAIVGTMQVVERERPIPAAFDALEDASGAIDVVDHSDPNNPLSNVVQILADTNP
jgi:hypothetical protein